MGKADGKKPEITITPADEPGPSPSPAPVPSPSPAPGPNGVLRDFKFPADQAGVPDALGGLTDTAGDTLASIPVSETFDQALEATAGSTKTKSSKRDRAKKFQKRVVLKLRDLGSRLKKRLQKGKKKMTPKAPALKLKVEIDNPAQMAGSAFPAPAA